MVLTNAEARMNIMLLELRAEAFGGAEFDATFINAGLPPEVVMRLGERWEAACHLGSKIIRIGKIVSMELARFAQENLNLPIA